MSRLPETDQSLVRKIRQRDRQAVRQADASAYTRSGMSVTAEGRVAVSGQLQSWDYDGTDRSNLGTTGWMLGPDDGGPSMLALNGIDVKADLDAKDAQILALITSLTAQQAALTAQVARIDALVNAQITAEVGTATGSGFAVGTSTANVALGAISVPSGYSRALVVATAGLTAVSATATATQVYVSASIDGVAGQELWALTAASAYTATITAAHTRSLSGLSGGTIQIGARVRSSIAWAAHPANAAVVSAAAVFFR